MFLGRRGFLALAMASSLGVPYLVTSSQQTQESTPGLSIANDPAADMASQGLSAQPPLAPVTGQRLAPLEGPAVRGLGEILRFDINPQWITGRWSRVMTVTVDPTLQGYRVPLVTGTGESDLAGSLTYYFDRQKSLERITFFGTTGDARPLVGFVMSQYGLLRETADNPGLYLYELKRDGNVVSQLQVQVTPVMRATTPHERFTVDLTLTRPSNFRMFRQNAGAMGIAE